jgi:hypothetical protein
MVRPAGFIWFAGHGIENRERTWGHKKGTLCCEFNYVARLACDGEKIAVTFSAAF